MQTALDHMDLNDESIQSVVSRPVARAPILCAHDHSAAAEEFLLLAHRLRRAKGRKPIHTVLVTSAIPDEGKSTVAANLASALSRNGGRTLLVDADLRRANLHKMFGLPSVPGLDAVLCAESGLQSALRRIEPVRLYFLPAGDRVKNPVALLEGDAFSSLLRCASEAFDWVIVDSPPLNPFADSQCIALRTDAILLVVRWGFTPRHELDYALATLDGLPLLGMVINKFVGPNEAYHHPYRPQAGTPSADPLPSVPTDEEKG